MILEVTIAASKANWLQPLLYGQASRRSRFESDLFTLGVHKHYSD